MSSSRCCGGTGITGVAGPSGGTEQKPVGLVYIALAGEEGTQVVERNFPGVRRAYNGRAYYAWSGDPHTGGAYSYLKTGQYTAFNGIQGRRSGNLHFAGEHTSVDFQGYMEGALRSGYRCAVEIAGRTPA